MHLPKFQREIIAALDRFHFLTAEQVNRLFYGGRMLSYAQNNLNKAKKAGWIEIAGFLPINPRGNDPYYYRLSARAIDLLGAKRRKLATRSPFTVPHTLAITDVLIGAECLARRLTNLTLRINLHDIDLKRQPFAVKTKKGRQAVVPDGLMLFESEEDDASYQYGICLEIDRGTNENRQEWQLKIGGLLTFARGPYQEHFDVGDPTFAILIGDQPNIPAEKQPTAKRARRGQLKAWTEDALTKLDATAYGEIFLFADIAATSDQLFRAPLWLPAFAETPVPLLEVGEG